MGKFNWKEEVISSIHAFLFILIRKRFCFIGKVLLLLLHELIGLWLTDPSRNFEIPSGLTLIGYKTLSAIYWMEFIVFENALSRVVDFIEHFFLSRFRACLLFLAMFQKKSAFCILSPISYGSHLKGFSLLKIWTCTSSSHVQWLIQLLFNNNDFKNIFFWFRSFCEFEPSIHHHCMIFVGYLLPALIYRFSNAAAYYDSTIASGDVLPNPSPSFALSGLIEIPDHCLSLLMYT